jgi:predicted membrane protein
MSLAFLIGYMVLLTILVTKFVSGEIDPDALRPEDEGLLLAFDHVMFVGVMTMALFGTLAANLHGKALTLVDRIVLWGITIGVTGFAVGLITVESLPKQIFTPIMGTALLIGIASYLKDTAARRS